MSNDIMTRDENVPAIADDFLIAVADQAERRVDAVMKIKKVALKVTNARDWTDQNGNPYLQVSGSEKIANLFNISWRINEPLYEEEPDGNFMYSIKGEFSLGGRTIEVEGTRSSKDPFFNRYEYIKKQGLPDERKIMPPSTIDKGDVKKAALTNLYGNGITRILGIRNLTWADLMEYAGIKQEDCGGKIAYKKEGGKPAVSQPQSKSQKVELTEWQAKYYPRIETALSTLFSDDQAAKDAKLVELTTWTKDKGKETEKVVDGTPNYQGVKTEKTLEILCNKLEKLAEKASEKVVDAEVLPEVCSECMQPMLDGACRNTTCCEGKDYE